MEETEQTLNPESIVLRLLEKILYMSEEQRINLLNTLEEREYAIEEKGERDNTRKFYSTRIYFTSKGSTYQGFSEDISNGGMFINTEEFFSPGQMIVLTIPFPDDRESIKVPAEVVRTHPRGIGVEFIKKLSPSAYYRPPA